VRPKISPSQFKITPKSSGLTSSILTGTGARALRMITEGLLRDLMFEIPSDPSIREIVIDKDAILDNAPPKVIRER
jgi:ATP-dependent Clp protease ATP-binding subunit ClpX